MPLRLSAMSVSRKIGLLVVLGTATSMATIATGVAVYLRAERRTEALFARAHERIGAIASVRAEAVTQQGVVQQILRQKDPELLENLVNARAALVTTSLTLLGSLPGPPLAAAVKLEEQNRELVHRALLGEQAAAQEGFLGVSTPAFEHLLDLVDEAQSQFMDQTLAERAESTRTLHAVALSALAVVAAFLGLFLAAGRSLATSILRPLRLTTAALRDIAQGEGDLTRRLDVQSADETGELATWFNCFVAKIHASMQQLAASSVSLSTSADGLARTSHELAGGAQEVTSQSSAVAVATEHASATVLGISGAAQQMSASVGSVAGAIEQMRASMQQVVRSCKEETKIAATADSDAHATEDIVEQLGRSAGDVGKAVGVIKAIADQTNMLAMNARIEAASAGLAGKGFAVVAQEVKDLAGQTAQATARITAQIEAMQKTTRGAVQAIQAITKVIASVNLTSETILGAVDEQARAVDEIAANMAGAQAAAGDIARNVDGSAHDLGEISTSISGVSRASAGTAAGVATIEASSKDLAGLATSLKTIVNQFQI